MKLTKIFLVGIAWMVISFAVHLLDPLLGMKYYTNPEYFSLWSKVMMPAAGAPPLSFTILSLVFGLVIGIMLAYVYTLIKGSLPGKGIKKGLCYGKILILVAGIPSFLMMLLILNIPMGLNILWLIEMIIIYLVGGIVFGKLIK